MGIFDVFVVCGKICRSERTHDSRIFVVQLLGDDVLFGLSDDGKHEWLALIATVGAYANVHLIGIVIFQICLGGNVQIEEECTIMMSNKTTV